MKKEVMTTATTWRTTMRERIDLKRNTLVLLGDQVSYSPDGMHLDLGAALRKLLAQTVNVHLDGVRGDFARVSEDVIFNLLLGNHAALAAHQQLQHLGFAGRQQLRPVVDRGLPVSGIEFEIGDPQRAAEKMAWPPQLGFQPRDQFFQREWLDQIIIRATAQALDPVVQAAARGQNQNRNRIVPMP